MHADPAYGRGFTTACTRPLTHFSEQLKLNLSRVFMHIVRALCNMSLNNKPVCSKSVSCSEKYIHLPAACPLLNTSSADNIGTDYDGAGQ